MSTLNHTSIQGFWRTYTPTIAGSGSDVGNGTVTAAYTLIGKTCFIDFLFVLGNTSTVGASFTFTTPFTMETASVTNADNIIGTCHMRDASNAASDAVGAVRIETSTTLRILQLNSTHNFAATSTTSPFTWTTSDEISALHIPIRVA